MNDVILMQKHQSFYQIRQVAPQLLQRQPSPRLQFFIHRSATVLHHHTDLLRTLKPAIHAYYLRMADLHQLINVIVDSFYGKRILQTLLEDFLYAEDEIAVQLLAEVDMRPFANSEQFSHPEVFVLFCGFAFGARGNGLDAEFSRQVFVIIAVCLYGGVSVVYALLGFAKSHVLVEVAKLLVVGLLGGVQDRQGLSGIAVSGDCKLGDDVFCALEKRRFPGLLVLLSDFCDPCVLCDDLSVNALTVGSGLRAVGPYFSQSDLERRVAVDGLRQSSLPSARRSNARGLQLWVSAGIGVSVVDDVGVMRGAMRMDLAVLGRGGLQRDERLKGGLFHLSPLGC